MTTETTALELALRAPKLAYMEEEELKKCLRYVFLLIGIRGNNLPDEVEKEFLHQYIRSHYGAHSAAEIRLAFDMAVQQKLDVDPVCYENFSVAYFARIMTAYRAWAGKQVKQIHQLPPPAPQPTKEERLKIDLEYVACRFFLINKLPCRL